MATVTIKGIQFEEDMAYNAIQMAIAIKNLMGGSAAVPQATSAFPKKPNVKSANGYTLCSKCNDEVQFVKDDFGKWKCVSIKRIDGSTVPSFTKEMYNENIHILHKCSSNTSPGAGQPIYASVPSSVPQEFVHTEPEDEEEIF
jgi:hypothetical protein